MRTPELKAFIQKHKSLFWYTPEDKKEDVSDELLIETILNHGTLDDFKELERLMGRSVISSIFMNLKGRKIGNYYPEIYNFFYLYFSKYAQGNIK
jgi:hypothetical protein